MSAVATPLDAKADESLVIRPEQIPQAFRDFVYSDSVFNDDYEAFDTSPFYLEAIEFSLEDGESVYELPSYWDWLHSPTAAGRPHALIVDVEPNLSPQVRDFLVFWRSGKKHFRWPIHPRDSFYSKVIERYLGDRKIKYEIKRYLIGEFTASRSLILTDPVTGYSVSDKPSTRGTSQGSGAFEDRPLPTRYAFLARRLSDYYKTMEPFLKHLKIAYEPLMIGFPPIRNSAGENLDLANSLRSMEELNHGYHHVSAFVAQSPTGLAWLAEKSGVDQATLSGKLNESLGAALVEMNLVLGSRYTSAHGQNIRFEFDEKWQPTGRVPILDITDMRPIAPIWKMRGQSQLLDQWIYLLKTGDGGFGGHAPIERDELALLVQDKFGFFDVAAFEKGANQRLKELGLEPIEIFHNQNHGLMRYRNIDVRLLENLKILERSVGDPCSGLLDPVGSR